MAISLQDMQYNQAAANKAIAEAFFQLENNFPLERSQYMLVVNYREPSYRRRMYLVDTESRNILDTFHVAHGTASTCAYNKAEACYFSNVMGSRKSSLGAMKTGEIYYGKYGKSLKLRGLEKGKNSLVYARYIVLHSSEYVTESYIGSNGYAGRSWGCLAVNPKVSSQLIDKIKDGTFVYAFY
jgi:hypothetical protein